jgi:hypothetical protein
MEPLRPEQVQDLYDKVLETANRFLRNAQQFEISILQGHNPSYDALAKLMRNVATLIHGMIDEVDPMMAQKAIEYTAIMEKMALAIKKSDQPGLDALVAELDRKPFL